MNKTILYQLLALLLLFGISTTTHAQVTIGAGTKPKAFSVLELSTESTKGGLRLPHLTTEERKTLSEKQTFTDEQHRKGVEPDDKHGLALGLTIYNTDTQCIEYWNTRKWVSLCLGSASLIIKANGVEYNPSNDANKLLAAGDESPELTIEDTPPCTGLGKPFSISIIIGGDFAFINHIDEASGKFSLHVSENRMARDRQVIVRITNNCIGEYKEYVFAQKGNETLCGGGTIPNTPAILSSSANNEICNGGSVHLYIDPTSITGNPTGTDYIWTSNEVELGRGMSYTATTSGTYMVYAGGIGCTALGSSQIKIRLKSETEAPNKPTISADNGGTICGGLGVSLKMETAIIGGQTIQWYKDGQAIAGATDKTYQVDAGGKGSYFAMLIDGSCQSMPSVAITVDEKPGSTPLDFQKSYVLINTKPMSDGVTLCADGVMDMQINPDNVQSYTYRWYLNGDLIGTGKEVHHVVGQSSGEAQFWVEASITGDANTCPKTLPSGPITITTGQTPSNITITGASYFCSNDPQGAMLTASWTEATPGTKYRWINTNNNKEETVTDDNTFYMGDLGAGKYKVIITSTAGCVGESAQTHHVDLLGAPILNWKVANPQVGENKANTFVVDNMGAVASQYIWTYSPTEGTTAAPSTNLTTITGNTAAITFTGAGTGVLTAEAVGICGRSKLNLNITISSDRPVAPTVDPAADNITVCNGQLYAVTDIASYKPGASVKWIVEKAGGAGNAFTTTQYGTYNEFCHVNFTGILTMVNVKAQVRESGVDGHLTTITSLQGSKSAANITQWRIKADGTASFAYDIAVEDYGANSKCGELSKRSNPRFDQDKEYSINTQSGSALPTSIQWSVTDIHNLLESNTDLTGTVATIRIKESLRDANEQGNLINNQVGKSFQLTASIVVATCSYVYTQEVWIKDCQNCTSVTDLEGNTYHAARFGTAGCWMTENLATTRKPNNTNLTSAVPGVAANATKAKPKLSGGEGWGRHYDWNVTMNGETFETITTQLSKGTSTVQGICPEGWVLPSDYDWNQLEKEIATNPIPYSTNTKKWGWNTSWEKGTSAPGYGWRPDGTNTAGGWGQSMKSSRVVVGLTNAAGTSNQDGTGFDALLVGDSGSINSYTYFCLAVPTALRMRGLAA